MAMQLLQLLLWSETPKQTTNQLAIEKETAATS